MTRPTALVVEDDPQLNQIFTLTLYESFEVETISDGDQALIRLSEIIPDLIVLDINLPGASGAEILDSIRASSRFDKTRVILATASTHQAKELQDKADIVLLKPISPIQLRDFAARLGNVK
jgi:DNA-binding response OmpR family regulator